MSKIGISKIVLEKNKKVGIGWWVMHTLTA